MSDPVRPRRLRRTQGLRDLVRETRLEAASLILPMFVVPGEGRREPVATFPGVAHLSADLATAEAERAAAAGVGGVILFGLPATKDAEGSSAWDRTARCRSRPAPSAPPPRAS